MGLQPLFGQIDSNSQTDPFSTSEVMAGASPEVKGLTGKPAHTVDGVLDGIDTTLVIDIGKLRTRSNTLIEIRLSNNTGIPFEFSEITASCSCIGGLPSGIKLHPKEQLPVRAKFAVSNEEERFEKIISLFDPKNSATCQIKLRGEGENLIKLEQSAFTVLPGRATFETSGTVAFDGFPADSFRFRPNNFDLVGFRFIPDGEKRAKIILDVLTRETDQNKTIDVTVIDESGQNAGVMSFQFLRKGKPVTRPSVAILTANSNQVLSAKILVQYLGLIGKGEEKKVQLRGVGYSYDQNEKEIEFEVHAQLRGLTDTVTVAVLEVTDPRVVELHGKYNLFTEFQVANERFSVPMSVMNERK